MRVRVVLVGLGFGLLLGGTALGLYSWFWASTVPLKLPSGLPQDAPKTFAVAAAIAGVLLLVVTVAAFRRGRRSEGSENYQGAVEAWTTFIAGFTLVVLAGMAYFHHLPSLYARIRTDHPYFTRLPTAMAATVLVAIGGLLVLGLLRRVTTVWGIGYRAIAVPAVVGLAVSAALGVVAVRAGDDSVNIDHTTAAPAAIPGSPDRLGAERYRIRLPPREQDDRDIDIVAAGTGFVIATPAGITAYDGATGVERWHYRRTPQNGESTMGYASDSLLAADGGAVVLAVWRGLGYRAFDAVTGEILWADSDFLRDKSQSGWFDVGREYATTAPQSLLLATATQTARYDARTGKRLWLTEIDFSSCPGLNRNWNPHISHAATDTTIYWVVDCEQDGRSWYQVRAFDAATGAQVASRDFAHRPTADRSKSSDVYAGVERMANTAVVSWSDRDTGLGASHMLIDAPGHVPSTPIRYGSSYRLYGADPSGPQVARHFSSRDTGDRLEIGDADRDTLAFTLTNTGLESTKMGPSVVFLGTEIAALVRDRTLGPYRLHVRSWSRENGAPASAQPVETGDEYCQSPTIVTAASALLVVCSPLRYDEQPTTVIGYTAEPAR
ncbi:PQQ-like beta-propeller repeat protein [Nocardia otitidiscaviarum]|nr:PQQ-binding-like beta-propeller repeat protein [Nocardia otitidiscaviarum]MCP9622929.1 PQQ-like beta-propeller repeat protein [Nocardia otitidiscaviarum]